jgi:uroporphyrinogen-III synthase
VLPLSGFTVGVTGHRRAAEQAEMLAKRGASVIVGPVIESVPLDDIDATTAATRALIDEPPDVLVLSTGVGTRSWLGVAEIAGLDDDLRAISHTATVLARGPKARSAAIAGGLDVSWQAPQETGAEIVRHLAALGVAGRRIGVQRDGAVDTAQGLAAAIRDLGADVVEVPVYRWKLPDDVQPALRLIAGVVAGRVDAVTFTSAVAVDHCFELAADEPALRQALTAGCTAVAVGPVTADALRRNGVADVVEPERARLGSMVQAVVTALGGRHRTLRYEGLTGCWQGLAVHVDGLAPVTLTPGEARLLRVLLDRAPGVVPKADLVEEGADAHAAETAVARLRAKLGPLGDGIWAVPRRGYRVAWTLGPSRADAPAGPR